MVVNNAKGQWEYKLPSEVYLLISHDINYLFRTEIYIISVHITFQKMVKKTIK